MHTRENLIKTVNDTIKELSAAFIINPLEYFYEEELRAELLYKLKQSASNKKINLPPNDWTKRFNLVSSSSSFKAEYPQIPSLKFDIAYIEKNSQVDNHYLWPCSLLLEIKLRVGSINTSILLKDYNKISAYQKTTDNLLGIAILFDQDPTVNKEKLLNRYKKQNNNFSLIDFNDLAFQDNYRYAVHLLPLANENVIILEEELDKAKVINKEIVYPE